MEWDTYRPTDVDVLLEIDNYWLVMGEVKFVPPEKRNPKEYANTRAFVEQFVPTGQLLAIERIMTTWLWLRPRKRGFGFFAAHCTPADKDVLVRDAVVMATYHGPPHGWGLDTKDTVGELLDRWVAGILERKGRRG